MVVFIDAEKVWKVYTFGGRRYPCCGQFRNTNLHEYVHYNLTNLNFTYADIDRAKKNKLL